MPNRLDRTVAGWEDGRKRSIWHVAEIELSVENSELAMVSDVCAFSLQACLLMIPWSYSPWTEALAEGVFCRRPTPAVNKEA